MEKERRTREDISVSNIREDLLKGIYEREKLNVVENESQHTERVYCTTVLEPSSETDSSENSMVVGSFSI